MSCLHRGPYVQRGEGIGSTLTSMFKGVYPALQAMGQKLMNSSITQKVLKTAKRSAVDAGLNVAKDVLKGKKIGESLSENISAAKKAVTDSLVSALDKAKVPVVAGVKRVKKIKTEKRKKKSRKGKVPRDIFDEKYD